MKVTAEKKKEKKSVVICRIKNATWYSNKGVKSCYPDKIELICKIDKSMNLINLFQSFDFVAWLFSAKWPGRGTHRLWEVGDRGGGHHASTARDYPTLFPH